MTVSTSEGTSGQGSGQPAERTFYHPGLIRRCIALCIDLVVLLILYRFFGRALLAEFDVFFLGAHVYDVEGKVLAQAMSDLGWLHILLLAGFPVLYFTLSEGLLFRTSFGKMLTGVYIMNSAGKSCSLFRALLRNLAKWLTIATLGLGMLPALFGPRSRSLHDLLSGTMPVRS